VAARGREAVVSGAIAPVAAPPRALRVARWFRPVANPAAVEDQAADEAAMVLSPRQAALPALTARAGSAGAGSWS